MFPGDVHGAVDIPGDIKILFQAFRSLVFEILRQSQLVPIIMMPADGLGAVGREYAAVGTLRGP